MQKTPKGVKLQNVSKIYSDPKTKKEFFAVDNVSLDIKPGTFITLLGPSGCGKTTTLRMIAGFETPNSGDIFLGDEAINHLPPNMRDTAMVFQSYALLPHYNVYDNVAYGLKIRKVPKDEIHQRVLAMLDLVELTGLEERMTNQLSGGQQQRVALARALVLEPGVLLFDEPLSNLDAKLRVAMRTEIRKIQKKVGITAVYVTHDQAEAMSIADQIVIMNKGIIAQMGTPEEIYFEPKNEFVADFIGEANFLDGVIDAFKSDTATITLYGKSLEVKTNLTFTVGEKCHVVLRPESISLSDEGILPCKVEVSTFMGSYQYYQVRLEDKMFTITEYNPKAKKRFAEGDTAYMVFDTANLHLLENQS